MIGFSTRFGDFFLQLSMGQIDLLESEWEMFVHLYDEVELLSLSVDIINLRINSERRTLDSWSIYRFVVYLSCFLANEKSWNFIRWS